MTTVMDVDTPAHQGRDAMAPDDGDSRSSFTSDEAQNGVKNIEAVSQTWTHWSLIIAYLG